MSSRWSLFAARTALILLVPVGYLILAREAPEYLGRAAEGLTGTNVTRNAANEFVLQPVPSQPAARAGVVEGDVLIAVDGMPVDPGRDVTALALRGPVGSTVVIDVRRDDSVHRIPIVRSADLAAANRQLGITMRGRVWYVFLLDLLPTITFTLVGAFVLLRGWHRPAGVLLALAFFLIAVGWSNVVVMAANTSVTAKIVLFASYTGGGVFFALLPDGRLTPRWGRWVVVAFAATGLISVSSSIQTMIPAAGSTLLWTALLGAGAAVQLTRYRSHSDMLQRRQIRLVVFSFAAAFVGYLLGQLPSAYLSAVGKWEAFYRYEMIGLPLTIVPVALIPVAIAIAVSKHGLWNVDTLINRSAVYSLVTLVLGTVWAATAVLIQASLDLFIGSYSTIAAAAVSSLQVAALFQPLRSRTQQWVDRRCPTESYVIEQKLQQLSRDVAHSFDVDVIPLVDERLRAILGRDDVQWVDGRVRVTAPMGSLQSKDVRRALETFAQTTAPYIAMREAVKRALQKEAALL